MVRMKEANQGKAHWNSSPASSQEEHGGGQAVTLSANGMALNVLADGEPTPAAGMTLCSTGASGGLGPGGGSNVAMMARLLLLSNEGRSDKSHHLDRDFIPGPVPTALCVNHHNKPRNRRWD